MKTRTQAQIEAARRNGAASRGPVTPEGKARSARNAEKHGMNAHCVVLRCESMELFEEFLDEQMEIYQPRTTLERDLVSDIVIARWRLRRILTMETAAFDFEMDSQREAVDAEFELMDQPTRAARAFSELGSRRRDIANYIRYESRLRRIITNAEARLEKIKKWDNEPERRAPVPPAGRTGADPQPSENAQFPS